jgi:hypothetical protein
VFQYRPKRSQEFYAPGRDILGYFRPLYIEALNIVRERHEDKIAETNKLEMLMNGIINEATAGAKKMEMHEIISAWQETLKDVDEEIANEFCRVFVSAIVFRYVLGKREVSEDQVKSEELGKAFGGMFVFSVLPAELAAAAKQHMMAYNHIPKIVVENEPPCVIEEVDEDNEQ